VISAPARAGKGSVDKLHELIKITSLGQRSQLLAGVSAASVPTAADRALGRSLGQALTHSDRVKATRCLDTVI
jgi:hypothetical protein